MCKTRWLDILLYFPSIFVSDRKIVIAASSCTWSIRTSFNTKRVRFVCVSSIIFSSYLFSFRINSDTTDSFFFFLPAWCITGSSKPTLPSICGDLTSDAILISLFRTGAAPMPCPFKGPLEFTYSHGEAECKSPLSAAETCTQESRLLFRYQACANVLSSESVGKYFSLSLFLSISN